MKISTGEKIFYSLNYIVLAVAGLSCIIPLIHTLALSLSDNHAVMSGMVSFLPVNFTFGSYDSLFKGTRLIGALTNSMTITLVGVTLSMLMTILAAYPLSRRYFYARRFFSLAIVFTLLFSGGIIPMYLLLKSLGLMNSYWALWLPSLVSSFNMLLMKTFFENIPEELVEAARMDGCSEWRLLGGIILPLSIPVMATLVLFYGVHYWNMFQNILLYITNAKKYNLTVLVQQMIQNQAALAEATSNEPQLADLITPESVRSAGVIILMIPPLLVYPFIQKYFVKGIMIGAVKG
ncbi:putative aldouronate transport system permease protein [Paenibacillus sp. 1_12]|uniref:carbohydrate ABC transporter permease n=1 Tax=Paenibacillus sp. 1_12 TaxID=1566278 RepID=UPI0008EAF94B|nr:carbohydrate ABC transporter permease [Paenibacillus sp. 1_12]SFL00242.1 putative aldouronate transport system permease protein [Paenibacillus sp. 1_12]